MPGLGVEGHFVHGRQCLAHQLQQLVLHKGDLQALSLLTRLKKNTPLPEPFAQHTCVDHAESGRDLQFPLGAFMLRLH